MGQCNQPKNSYRRVYNNNDTFSYPQLQENIIRRRGELYFRSTEINATSEGSVSTPKYSLLKYFKEIEIPNLERLTEEISSSCNQQVLVRYQMDSAGPHTDRVLLDFLEEEFIKRDWMLVRQPAQSPLTNVKDTCIFPCLSKQVSAMQSDIYNSKVLDWEELNNCVTNSYNNLPLDTVARSYLGHHQIVNAIARDNGGDDHMKEKNGIHVGVRKNCVPIYDETEGTKSIGVFVVQRPDGATVEEQVQNWKYEKPDVSQREITCLNKSE